MNEKDFTDLAVRLQGVDSRARSNEHRIETLEENMKELQETQISLIKIANSVETIGKSVVTMQRDIKDVKRSQDKLTEKVSDIENQSARELKTRWNTLCDKLLWLAAGGAAIGILNYLFPKIPW